MKANEIFKHIMDNAYYKKEETCDKLIAGDPEKEVKKVGVCFKLTAKLIEKAMNENFDMIITHEPTFALGDVRETALPIDVKKWQLLDQSALTVYRFHDHAHNSMPDYIHAGFLKALNLHIEHKYERESLGVCRYVLKENLSVKKIAKLIEKELGVDFVRIVGNQETIAKTICLGLGSVGMNQINILMNPGCDLFITGETGEVCICQYINDACYFGENKAILLLGHCSSEYAGMRLLAEELNNTLIQTEYLHCNEVYNKIEN